MLTDSPLDQLETAEVCVTHRAMTLTEYVPAVDQLFEALVVPTDSQPEVEPSPQSKRYWMLWPRLDDEPPVE